MSDTDDIFLKRFSMIIMLLILITFGILILADRASKVAMPGVNPSRVALTNDRTMPESRVRTQLAEAGSTAIEPVVMVEAAPMSGAEVYAGACQACHMAGAAGAPIPGSDLWNERATKGLETLAYNAINGLNAMPAKGGRADLSDAEVTAAVEHMLAQ